MSNTPMKRPPLSTADLTPAPGSDVLRAAVDTGPVSPYGENATVAEAKKIPFEETQISWVQGNFPAAIKRYVAEDFKNYGHLGTHGKVDYVEPDQSQLNPPNYGAMLKQHIRLGLPQMATVDGDLIVMFGQGVDLVQVRNGKEVARWDASPPLTTHLEPPVDAVKQ